MRLSRHVLGAVLVQELVDTGLGQAVADLQVMDEEGQSRCLLAVSRERLVLQSQLEARPQCIVTHVYSNTVYSNTRV